MLYYLGIIYSVDRYISAANGIRGGTMIYGH